MTSECEIRLPATLDECCGADGGGDGTGVVRSDSYYASAFNCPDAGRDAARAEENGERPWGLCGFNPPRRLRVPGYAYDMAEDSYSNARARGGHRGMVIPRTIDEREVAFTPDAEDGDGDAARRAPGAIAHAFDADARRRTTTTPGGMSSRPSWGENAYHASQCV